MAERPDGTDDEEAARVRELIEAGGDVAGGLVGGGLGLLGGPRGVVLGAAGGVIVSRLVKKVGAELHERILGPRQVERMGVALAASMGEIAARLERGDTVRQDGFFAYEDPEYSDAAELLEGVLLRAADAYQQRKVPYLGSLYASIAFREDIGPDYAHELLQLADRVTYRQLQAIAFLAEKGGSKELAALETQRAKSGMTPSSASEGPVADGRAGVDAEGQARPALAGGRGRPRAAQAEALKPVGPPGPPRGRHGHPPSPQGDHSKC